MFFFPITREGRKLRGIAKTLYAECVRVARTPEFYSHLNVPDTVTGRFEMVSLHAGLLINRLKREGVTGNRLAQAVFDEMFLNMDIACRQIGIGDLGVPKQIKKMMTALQGKALHYEAALTQGSHKLHEAIAKNIYATAKDKPDDTILNAMADYFRRCADGLQHQNIGSFLESHVSFAPLSNVENKNDQSIQAA